MNRNKDVFKRPAGASELYFISNGKKYAVRVHSAPWCETYGFPLVGLGITANDAEINLLGQLGCM